MIDKTKIKIDGKMKTKITSDWLSQFPSYKKARSQAWKKRVGPMVLNMGYNVQGSEYKIEGSYFNLSNPLDFLCANLTFEPKEWHCYNVKWEKHEQGRYVQSAQEMREAAPIPLEGPVTLSQVINAYKNNPELEFVSSKRELDDPILIAAWAGKVELAKELLGWAKPYYEKRFSDTKISTEEWYQWMLEKISDPEKLRQTVEEQIVFHKLTKIPYEELIIDID